MSTEGKEELSCSVCYGNLTLKNLVMTTCNHMYCNGCFFRWLRTNNTCAMCRKDFLNNELERNSMANLSMELVDMHLRSKEIMEKNVNLIKETRRLNNEILDKNVELKKKTLLESKYNKKLQESRFNYKKLETKKMELLKKIRLLKLKKINESVKKLRLSGKLIY
tara:strand:- start:134 stop:628 length:495 start_codon:yes stop_codon:yes gene_type:complete